ncbi:DNA polymerase delta catalytic subunit [Gryllus bimaculatus]|nr:DNA polymerase delta catalytic subunit [Gryllus bimaculatus]
MSKATDSSNSSVSNLLAQTQFRQQLVTPQAGKSHDSLGFKMSYENLQDCRAVVEPQYLTLLAIELHIQTRGDLCPDPAHDSVCAVFYCVQNDVPQESMVPNLVTGMIVVQNSTFKKSPLIHNIEVDCRISYVPNEKALMEEIIQLVQLWDPDILAGYESYTFENISFHVLHERIPLVSFKTLTQWWGHRTRCFWGRVADHYLLRVRGLIRILEQLDLINRTSELARIFGIQFYEVLSRGSQFRVESMMLRLAKPMNYIPVSPSVQQRARMRAPEYLQLIMEPESQLYVDPVIVLDFQSLYPSMIIAYNYCFSTCLGRVEHLGQTSPFEFGSSHLLVPPEQIKQLLGNIHISPSGQVFVKSAVRKGVMPLMLKEILDTRLMVKKSMKEHKDDKTLQRVLHSRQLGLKLIANVTYGYTAANFSGRMACVEVADSVVSKGRETLERAIHLVENTAHWGARVVYGDTDSLFVLVPGRSREDAFAIGAEIAEAVTQDNPHPVKLKLEKIYQPCILQTKKRYVGYMYESANQKEPVYDAKGIETVRRDGCPAVAKVLEKSLHLLFETKDMSKVKAYVQRKFSQILEGQMSIQDLTFAREYRGKGGYKPGACVPALELAKRWLSVDPRAEPRVSERVPYIVISGAPNVPLIQLVRSPHDLLAEPGLKVHAHYYICQSGICGDCQKQPQITAVSLATKIHEWERHFYNLEKV